MRVRVYDREKNMYFKSDVYAKINHGYYEKFLVMTPASEGGCLKLYDYIDKSTDDLPTTVNVNIIHSKHPDEWVEFASSNLGNSMNILHDGDMQLEKFDYYVGYDYIWENKKALCLLLQGMAIPLVEFYVAHSHQTCGESWSYVNTKEDIKKLMDYSNHFHDSIIKTISYISGSAKQNNEIIACDDIRTLTIKIDSCWCNSLELVFEGVLSLNLRPAKDNHSSNIWAASIMIENEIVFFSTDDVSDTNTFTDDTTWVSAFSLKWKCIEA